jgi:hypothetical protein
LAVFDFTVTSSEAETDNDQQIEDDERLDEAEQEMIEEMKEIIELDSRDDIGIPMSVSAGHAKPARPETGSASVLIAYQRSAKFGLGSVLCWVDDERDQGTIIDGYWQEKERNMGVVAVVAEHLTAGPHRLSCELLEQTADPGGGKEFRFIAVMHG